ncbi:MAG: hypothetical protein MZW92_05645 [Comamonadaceae bacterium]|nr:hypothetical protein [Comamonadaceae bacterium]
MPHEIDLQYAVAAALVTRRDPRQGNAGGAPSCSATSSTTPARLPLREMGVMLVSDLHRARRRRAVRRAASSRQWAERRSRT